ncbi:MAG TPA: hypothetical protein VLE91_00880 [Candidatus Saccharimonadales bacterium]|nr:hypothetical protein [Candidatus Saccharimonadales bacterium]
MGDISPEGNTPALTPRRQFLSHAATAVAGVAAGFIAGRGEKGPSILNKLDDFRKVEWSPDTVFKRVTLGEQITDKLTVPGNGYFLHTSAGSKIRALVSPTNKNFSAGVEIFDEFGNLIRGAKNESSETVIPKDGDYYVSVYRFPNSKIGDGTFSFLVEDPRKTNVQGSFMISPNRDRQFQMPSETGFDIFTRGDIGIVLDYNQDVVDPNADNLKYPKGKFAQDLKVYVKRGGIGQLSGDNPDLAELSEQNRYNDFGVWVLDKQRIAVVPERTTEPFTAEWPKGSQVVVSTSKPNSKDRYNARIFVL